MIFFFDPPQIFPYDKSGRWYYTETAAHAMVAESPLSGQQKQINVIIQAAVLYRFDRMRLRFKYDRAGDLFPTSPPLEGVWGVAFLVSLKLRSKHA